MRKFLQRIVLSCLLVAMVWLGSFLWFITQIPTQPSPPSQADAIVVLTGGSGRIELGIDLLMAEKGKQLFVSGAHQEVSYADIVRLTPRKNREMVRQSVGHEIILGNNAENTIGNAQEVKQWLDTTRYQRVLLVTSNYHMPRSLSEFAELMPERTFIPMPVVPANTGFFWWLGTEYRSLVYSEYYKYIISKLRHWAIHNVFANRT